MRAAVNAANVSTHSSPNVLEAELHISINPLVPDQGVSMAFC